jgi:Fe2+ transport system protein B
MKEDIIQQQIIGFLSVMARKYNFIFFAPCNEGFLMIMKKFRVPQKSQYAIMSWLRKMGFLPGVSDLIIGWNGKMFTMELKTDIGKQSKNQILFETNCKKTSIDYRIVRSVKQCQDVMYEWGILS